MRWANFCAHRTRPRANFETNNTSAATDAGQYETTGTTARPQTATIETGNTTATEKCTKNSFFSPAKATAVSIGARPARAKVTPVSTDPPHRPAKATPVSRERFPMPAGGGRARLRYPWAAARPGRATSGRPTLQTSSNQRNSNRLARTSVTNVVNLSPKTSIFTEKADGLTTFVTTGQKSTRKTPWIDDVCNNTHQTTPKHCNSNVANSMFEQVAGELRAKLMGDGRARPGFETTHRATSATRPHWCEGRRRDLPRCRWAVAGPGRASRRRAERSSRAGRRPRAQPAARPDSTPRGARNTRGAASNAGDLSGQQATPEICRGNKQHEAARPHTGPGGSRVRPLGGSQR